MQSDVCESGVIDVPSYALRLCDRVQVSCQEKSRRNVMVVFGFVDHATHDVIEAVRALEIAQK